VTTSPNQSSAPTFSPATIATVLARGIAAHPDMALRMDRAATIVERGGVQVEPYGWSVASECTEGKAYTVTPDGACSCPDFARRGGPCKHAVAVQMQAACVALDAFGKAPHERRVTPALAAGPVDADAEWAARTMPDAAVPYEVTPQGEAYLRGARDGHNGRPMPLHASAAYRAGYRDGESARHEADAPPAA
jgi:hypothetical protein